MPRNKDLKRLVRARMKKTGEAYTAARAHITRTKSKRAPAAVRSTATPTPVAADSGNYAELAGMSDAVIKEKTGCTWDRWVFALDHYRAAEMSHGEIAKLVKTKYKVADWWSQMVTVGYERIKGLRAIGQRLDGSYEASKSRTYNVPVKTLFEAWADTATRKRWLKEADVKVRTATAPKTMRLGWSDGTIIAVGFTPKGKSKSSVALAHTKLPDAERANSLKKFWSDRLDALGEVLDPSS
jgi:hypothetical protein